MVRLATFNAENSINDETSKQITPKAIKEGKIRLLCVTIISVLLFSCAHAPYTRTVPPAPEPSSRAFATTPAHLIERIEQTGELRVVIKLKVAYSPEKNLKNEKAIRSQRSAIEAVQNKIGKELLERKSKVIRKYRTIPYIAASVNRSALDHLLASPDVESVEEDVAVPPLLDDSTDLVGARKVWGWGLQGNGQTIAILDTGVETRHDQLHNKVVGEACFSAAQPPDEQSLCPNGTDTQIGVGAGAPCSANIQGCEHGTHVAGIASGWNGVAPNSQVVSIQVFHRVNSEAKCSNFDLSAPCTLSYDSDQLAALEWVYDHTDNVIGVPTTPPTFPFAAVNMSLGAGRFETQCTTDSRKAAIDNLRSLDVATIIAAGNDGYRNALGSPACIDTAISVGSTCKQDEISDFSNRADFLSLLAPGEDIESAVPINGTATLSGTSMAAPHVAGAWAILKSCAQNRTVDGILGALRTAGIHLPGSTAPRIRIDGAASMLCPDSVPTTTHFDVVSVDFTPEDGNYDVNWPGPPRRPWTEADKDFYQVRATISDPAPEDFKLGFWIKEDRSWWPDPTLGSILVSFTNGSIQGNGRFWLVCTKKGKVKGSEGKGDDQHANVYLESFDIAAEVDSNTWTWDYDAPRITYTVNCR